MLSYKIISKKQPQTTESRTLSNEAYRDIIYERVRKQCRIKPKDKVRVRGSTDIYEVVEIIEDKDKVIWLNNRPLIVVVDTQDGHVAFSTKQLRLLRQFK